MHARRCYVSYAALDETRLIAVSGFDGFQRHLSAESYSIGDNQWQRLKDCNTVRYSNRYSTGVSPNQERCACGENQRSNLDDRGI